MSTSNNSLLIDIGSDLGFLGLRLLKEKIVQEVWNIELSKVALKKSEQLYCKAGLDSYTKFIFSNGFSELLSREIESYEEIIIVLAGLGSNKIISILEKFPSSWKNKKLWLCCLPHANPEKIKNWAEGEWKLFKEDTFKLREKNYSIFLFSLKSS